MDFASEHSAFGKEITQSIPERDSNLLRRHTELGCRLLETTESPILALAATIAMSHHERWNGTGYPLCLVGEEIPIAGRITAVADVFDALSSKRPYKPAFPFDKCMQILEDGRGSHFDPVVLDAFFRRRQDIVQTQLGLADPD